MTRLFTLLLLVAVLAVTVGCKSTQPATQTYAAGPNGAVSPTVRAAMDPRTDAGPQEIFGINIPGQPFGIPFAFKAGVLYDGEPFIWNPVQPNAAQIGPCSTAQGVVMVPQTAYVEERRVVPQTKMVPHVLVPAPQAAPQAAPCR